MLVVGHPSGGRRGAHCGLDLFVEAPEQRLCLFLALAGIGRRKGAASRRGSMPSRPGYAGEGCVFNGFSPDIDGEGAVGSGWGGVALTSLPTAGGASMGAPPLRPGTTAVRQGAASRVSASGWCAQPGNSEPFRPVTMICAASAQTNRPIRRLTICRPWSPSRRSMRSER